MEDYFNPIVVSSVFGSFIAMATLTMISLGILSSIFNVKPTPFWLILDLITGTCFAVVGGYLAAEIPVYLNSPQSVISSIFGLGCFIAFMSGICAFSSLFQKKGTSQPVWFHAILLVTSNIGIMKGASLALGSSDIFMNSTVFPLAGYTSCIL